MSALLNGLNPAQRAAVTSTAPVILTLAGAGSGKTRVLTHRIAHLNQEHRVGTSNMLALTFTRLAGKEMKERVMALVGETQGKKLYCNTFHAFAAGVLSRWGHKLGIDPGYTIYDQKDRVDIMQTIIDELKPRTTLKKVLGRFDNLRGVNSEKANYPEECRVLLEYDFRLRQNNAVDIDRMIDLVVKLWTICPEALEEYRRDYTHVFVDEFQDTSDDQMEMIKLLQPAHLFVVGDDYQAIYGWRKARVEYILSFPDQYPGCEVFKLEDNYRSTSQIITAANSLIKHNTYQTKKTLIAQKEGPPIKFMFARDQLQEALTIGKLIESLTAYISYSDIAVMARTNAMIEGIEVVLDSMGIPVLRVTGVDETYKNPGTHGILEWMDLINNKRDTMTIKKCLKFFINQPNDLQLKELELEAMRKDITPFEAMELHQQDDNHFSQPFIKKVREIELAIKNENAYTPSHCYEITDRCLGTTEYYKRAGLTNRVGDMQKTMAAIKAWEKSKTDLGESRTVQTFLKWLRYRDVQEKLIEKKQAVKLMTIHASKGLEFSIVILAGMNQGVFPSKRAEPEEERRVCYVAVTRPKQQLIITRSETVRDFRGSPVEAEESQYLGEMGI